MKTGNAFIRTVTHNHICTVLGVEGGLILVENVSWVADTGVRLCEFLSSGPTTATEIEPMPGCFAIGLGAIIDVSAWPHPLPTRAQ